MRFTTFAMLLLLVTFSATAGEPAFKSPLVPEANPWADVGIESKYGFGAYYTRKNVDEPWHQASRTDEYADISVRFDNTGDELIFWRGSSYLPYWKTGKGEFELKEVLERTGDGPASRPDKVNRYSNARIIESTPRRVVIHWRYMPKMPEIVGPVTIERDGRKMVTMTDLPDQTQMADEYFAILPDRTVVRSVLAGQSDYQKWRDAAPGLVFRYQLTEDGIEELPVLPSDGPDMLKIMGFTELVDRPAKPVPILADYEKFPKPLAHFRFDEGKGRSTVEEVSKKSAPITGHHATWRGGVSGTALQFDGWTSDVSVDRDLSGKIENELTLDAWVCIAAYPWNTCPVVQQRDLDGIEEGAGFILGLEADGRPSLTVTCGEDGKHKEVKLHGGPVVPRFQWTRLTGIANVADGKCVLRLYMDGKQVGMTTSLGAGEKLALAQNAPIRIGQGAPKRPHLPVGRGNYVSQYAFDGQIDEVRIYDKAVADWFLRQSQRALPIGDDFPPSPDMIRRKLPAGDEAWNDFAARYVHLPFHDAWNRQFRMSGHPDIVVSFDKMPCRYVLWHGVGYIPMLVSENGRWYSNEFNENWWKGCCEPMSDKKMLFGRVHVLEQSPARIVLKWRYPLSTVGYEISYEDPETGWGNWATWYFVIYPDGSMVKRLRVYMAEKRRHEWHESMAIMGPEQHPEQVIDSVPALTLMTAEGEKRKYSWIKAPPTGVNYKDTILHIVNMKAEYDPYTIQAFTGGDVYKNRGGTGYSVFPAWNHWPVGQLPSDGRHAIFPDRAAHSSITHVRWNSSTEWGEKGLFEEKIIMEGLSNQSAEQLLPLAKSWLSPPAAELSSDNGTVEFSQAERAYVLSRTVARDKPFELKLAGTKDSPIVNPALVIPNWGRSTEAEITLDGLSAAEYDIRQGVVRQANGVNKLIVWIELSLDKPVTIGIAP